MSSFSSSGYDLGEVPQFYTPTWTLQVCPAMAFWTLLKGFGLGVQVGLILILRTCVLYAPLSLWFGLVSLRSITLKVRPPKVSRNHGRAPGRTVPRARQHPPPRRRETAWKCMSCTMPSLHVSMDATRRDHLTP